MHQEPSMHFVTDSSVMMATPFSINQSINQNLTSVFSSLDDVRDVSSIPNKHGTSRERIYDANVGNKEKVIKHEAGPVTGSQSVKNVNLRRK